MRAQLGKEVLSSWERCMKKGIPAVISIPRIILQMETTRLNDAHALLISVFERAVKSINHFISASHLFLLTDPDGTLLVAKGSKMILQMLKTSGIETGTSFSEESCGTNAIALARKLKQPVYLFPEQHYCNFLKKWHCYAVPLVVGGEIKGYLDISTIEQDMKKELIAIIQLLAAKIVNEYMAAGSPETSEEIKLNVQQLTVLKLLSQGLTTEAAALEIGISVNTIKYHKKKVFRELGVQSTGEAVAKAVKAGLI